MSNSPLILYHYPASPYAEKVRLLAGYLGVRWQSLEVPIQPPREQLAILAGGYRRIPVMQCGADIFCDTAVICDEVISRADRDLASCSEAALALAKRAETDVFFAAIRQGSQLKTAIGLTMMLGFKGMLAFAKDRASFSRGHGPAAQAPDAARSVFSSFLRDLDQMLASQSYLGGDAPCLSDFCCYHPIFLAQGFKSIKASALPAGVKAWMARMTGFGWGQYSTVSIDEAMDEAKAQEPRPMPEARADHPDAGQWVTVTPLDTGRVPVTGTLVSRSETRIIVARRSEDVGLCHVHFPASGFECSVIT
jgi:glutathione S-transferase